MQIDVVRYGTSPILQDAVSDFVIVFRLIYVHIIFSSLYVFVCSPCVLL